MTQKYRWLAALTLLLAFGACAVRAEEEEEEVARPQSVVELPKLAVMPTAMPSPVFPLLFAPPCPCPCPMPIPTGIYAIVRHAASVPAAEDCRMPIPTGIYAIPPGPVCLPPCCNGACSVQVCGSRPTEDTPQYVVETRMVKGDDADAEVTVCPRVSVFEGQPATIHLQGYQTPQGQCSLQMLMSVTKQGKGARLALAVTEASADDGDEAHLREHTETTQVQCNVPFGKPYKMELKKDSDGTVGAWMEVTVTEVEREQRPDRTACDGCPGGACPASLTNAAEDDDATPLDTAGEVVDCLFDILSDTATSAFGWRSARTKTRKRRRRPTCSRRHNSCRPIRRRRSASLLARRRRGPARFAARRPVPRGNAAASSAPRPRRPRSRPCASASTPSTRAPAWK